MLAIDAMSSSDHLLACPSRGPFNILKDESARLRRVECDPLFNRVIIRLQDGLDRDRMVKCMTEYLFSQVMVCINFFLSN